MFGFFHETKEKKVSIIFSHFGPFPDNRKLREAVQAILDPQFNLFNDNLIGRNTDEYLFYDYNLEEINLEILFSEIVHPAVVFFKHKTLNADINIAKMLLERNRQALDMISNPEFLYYPELNTVPFKSIRTLLKDHPKSLKCYEDAISKYGNKKYKRNILDDLRLCFEYLLKDILGTSKSIENQKNDLGSYLKQNNVNKELRSTYMNFLDYLLKYNNQHVKHNDDVDPEDLEFVMEMSVILMKYIIKK